MTTCLRTLVPLRHTCNNSGETPVRLLSEQQGIMRVR